MAFLRIILLCFTLFSLQLSVSSIAEQNDGKITVGQSLTATSNGPSLLSTSGDFAFGFHQVPNDNMFLLAIWYAKIPDTIVWYANDGNLVPQGSSLNITNTDGLVLNDPHGTRLWSTNDELSSGKAVSYGFINNTGNFVLKSSDTDDAVWQSFDHPTDTLLPTQMMERGGKLISRRTETNFTKGRFQLLFQSDGNLALSTRDLLTGQAYGAYYLSWTNDDTTSESPGERVTYSESGNLYIQEKNGSRLILLPAEKLISVKNNYQRVTLNFDGLLTSYYHPKIFSGNKGSWSKIQFLPDNICMKAGSLGGEIDSGPCGYNNICSIGADQRPKCQCPLSYSLLDPNDTYGNCKSDFKIDVCDEKLRSAVKQEYKLVQVQNIDWPFADYVKLDPCSEEDCKTSCLNDYFCAAATWTQPTCWKKRLPLANGRQDSQVTGMAWLKVGIAYNNPLNPINPTEIIKVKRNYILPALLGSSVCVNFLLLSAIVLGILYMYRRKHSTSFDVHRRLQRCKSIVEYSRVHCFSYKDLEDATEGFKEEIGRGAFGTVYKGIVIVAGPPIPVAVKKLHQISKEADQEFKAEVNVIGRTHHKNLVPLVGFCKENDQRLLVYEYMSNGTVADYLFDDLKPDWNARIQIAQASARGLLYLHEECSRQIIHCDIKPRNILLDNYQNARISDFGLAKLLDLNQTNTNTAIRGTKGYVAPEWFRSRQITSKVDVYSFGVVLLEIICCRKSVCMDLMEEEAAILTDWAFDCHQSNQLEALVNGDIEALNDIIRLKKLVKVALWCIQEDPSLRPTMRSVTQMLEGVAEVPDPPCPTSFANTIQH